MSQRNEAAKWHLHKRDINRERKCWNTHTHRKGQWKIERKEREIRFVLSLNIEYSTLDKMPEA